MKEAVNILHHSQYCPGVPIMASMTNLRTTVALAIAALAGVSAAAGCAADNCYRALFPCPSPSAVSVASAFCATITASGTTATNYPTRATNACGITAGRYISACQCGPTCSYSTSTSTSSLTTSTASACEPPSTSTTSTTPACEATPTSGNLLYGDFECGLTPWTAQVFAPFTSIYGVSVNTPGFTNANSFRTQFLGTPNCATTCTYARLTSPLFPVTPGVKYKYTFATWFDGVSRGFVGTKINDRTGRTVDAVDYPVSKWRLHHVPFQANATENQVSVFLEWLNVESKLDSITFAPLTAYCGNTPPVGMLPDGEFECGIGAWTQQKPDLAATAGVVNLTADSLYTNSFPMGDYAWRVVSPATPNPANQELHVSARIISGAMSVTPGKKYLVYFTSFFSSRTVGSVGVMINNSPIYTRNPNDSVQGTPTFFSPNHIIWTATPGVTSASVKIEALMFGAGTIAIDSVLFVEVNDSVV
ncbi:hypothetical protein QBC36DRAFT_333920 [Triangularia setosa]|uniref:CBM-cenC domain-containing protein n=1 Tax=Triangularia setosa TaxID=2587417 RepID=A0AAN7A515_9PEZI|nr:hypothetical protein QBC36DRAFT_333920 [Podospora setosa]